MNQQLYSWSSQWLEMLWHASWTGGIAILIALAAALLMRRLKIAAWVEHWLWRLVFLKLLLALFITQPIKVPLLPPPEPVSVVEVMQVSPSAAMPVIAENLNASVGATQPASAAVPETDGGLSVVAHQFTGWIDVSPFDPSEVLDAYDVLAPYALGLLGKGGAGNGQFRDLLRRGELTGRCDPETFVLQVDPTGIHNPVLDPQRPCQVFRGQPELGELGLRGFYEDALVLNAPEIHPGHARYDDQLLADVLRVLLELRVAVAVAGDGHQEAVDEPEVNTKLKF